MRTNLNIRPILKISLCFYALVAFGCGGQPGEDVPPTPSPIDLNAPVAFRYAGQEEGDLTYELTADQSRMIVSLLNSTPSVSHDAADWHMEAADPICSFMVGNHWYQYHGFLLHVDSQGNAYIWEHPFIRESLWHPPPKPDTVAERFGQMVKYEWPNE